MTNTHEHLEQAEHSQHAVHDPFDRRVAVTMAIIAALLAAVTMLSHRSHNETLQLQAEANRLVTDANIHHTRANIHQTQAADEWGYYQAKNIRRHEYQSFAKLASFLAVQPGAVPQRDTAVADWTAQLTRYKEELPQHEKKARGFEAQRDQEQELAQQSENQAQERLHASHRVHIRAGRFDLGELAIELGLVLCSLAVLTNRRPFWYAGIAAALVGLVVIATVLTLPGAHVGHVSHPTEGPAPAAGHEPAEHS